MPYVMISSYFTSENVAEELDAQDQEKKVWKDYSGDDVREKAPMT
jgi:hypothetical protein